MGDRNYRLYLYDSKLKGLNKFLLQGLHEGFVRKFSLQSCLLCLVSTLAAPVIITAAPIVFDPATGELKVKVDAGSYGLLSLSLLLQSEDPLILQAQPETLSTLIGTVEGMATFNTTTNNLILPEVFVNGQAARRNVILKLTDQENFFFTQLSSGMAYSNFESAERDEQTSNATLNLSIPSCSIYAEIENTQYCSIIKDGLTREFYIYIPSSYSEYISPIPILFSLHGGGDYAEYNMRYSGFKEHADKDPFILIYPQGYFYGDKGTTGWNTESEGINDVAFIERIIDWVGGKYNAQLSEVYVTGFSNGGFMSYHLACNLSAKIAAIAPVAGLMGNYTFDTCSPLHPTPLIHIHGEQDKTISLGGSSYYRALEESRASAGVMTLWQVYNHCTEFSQELLYDDDRIKLGMLNKWTNCLHRADINYWRIFNQGHEWDGPNDFDTSQTIWNFLRNFDLNGAKN